MELLPGNGLGKCPQPGSNGPMKEFKGEDRQFQPSKPSLWWSPSFVLIGPQGNSGLGVGLLHSDDPGSDLHIAAPIVGFQKRARRSNPSLDRCILCSASFLIHAFSCIAHFGRTMRITLNTIFLMVMAGLFSASLFFSLRVWTFKRNLNSRPQSNTIQSGQEVTVSQVIDGDEVVVRLGNEQVTLRLLGIISYDPTMSDPAVLPTARQAVVFLEQTLLNQKANLVFDALKYDKKKRLLAYLHREGQDVGWQMLSRGLSLAYIKYPFSRQSSYVAAELQAQTQHVGLWADKRIALRSKQLRITWQQDGTVEE